MGKIYYRKENDSFLKYIINPSNDERKIFRNTYKTFHDINLPFEYSKIISFDECNYKNSSYILLESEYISGWPFLLCNHFNDFIYIEKILNDIIKFHKLLQHVPTTRGFRDYYKKYLKLTKNEYNLNRKLFLKIQDNIKVFARDPNPSNILFCPEQKIFHIDLLNDENTFQLVDFWFFVGFLKNSLFKRVLKTRLKEFIVDDFAIISLIETLNFTSFFIKNPFHILCTNIYNLIENMNTLLCMCSSNYFNSIFKEIKSKNITINSQYLRTIIDKFIDSKAENVFYFIDPQIFLFEEYRIKRLLFDFNDVKVDQFYNKNNTDLYFILILRDEYQHERHMLSRYPYLITLLNKNKLTYRRDFKNSNVELRIY